MIYPQPQPYYTLSSRRLQHIFCLSLVACQSSGASSSSQSDSGGTAMSTASGSSSITTTESPPTTTTSLSATAAFGSTESTSMVTVSTSSGDASTSGTSTETGGEIIPCETWDDMCPSGMKCIPYSEPADAMWNTQGCFPVVESPADLGEPCEMLSVDHATFDSCKKGLYCWNSTCMPLCQGSPVDLSCPGGFACATVNMQALAICLPACDPRVKSCAPDEVCSLHLNIFVCIESLSELEVFSPCQANAQCANGLICEPARNTNECADSPDHCCTALCSTDEPGLCPGVGQECKTYFGLPEVPEYLDLGYCSL